MKKLSVQYVLFCLVTMGILASCGKKDNTPTTPPSVGFLNSNGVDTVATAGDSVAVTFIVTQGGKTLSQIAITVNGNNYGGFNGGGPAAISSSDQETVMLASPSAGGQSYTYMFIATDKDGNTGKDSFIVVSPVAQPPVQKNNAVTLGAQYSSYGSFYNLAQDSVYTSTNAQNNPSAIDLVFAQISSSYTPTFISPDYTGHEGLTKFTGTTTTYFELSNLDFTSATSAQIGSAAAGIPQDSTHKTIAITANDTYTFITSNGEKGLIKVDNIIAGTAGSFKGTTMIEARVRQ